MSLNVVEHKILNLRFVKDARSYPQWVAQLTKRYYYVRFNKEQNLTKHQQQQRQQQQ